MVNRPKWVLTTLISIALTSTVSAQTLLGTYEFTNNSLVATDADAADGITLSNLSIGTYTKGELFSDGSNTKANKKQDYISLTRSEVGGISTTKQIKAGRYLSFTVTNNSGQTVTFEQLTMDITNVNVPKDRYLNSRVFTTSNPNNIKGDTIAQIGKPDDSEIIAKTSPLDGSAPDVGSKHLGNTIELANNESMTFYLPLVAEKDKGDATAKEEHMQFDDVAIYASSPAYVAIPEPQTVTLWMSLLTATALLTSRRYQRR